MANLSALTTNMTETPPVGHTVDSNNIIGAVAGLLGTIGNGMVCFVMIWYRSFFKSVTNKLMLHQSVVDLVLSLVMLVTRLYTPWTQFYCRFSRGWLYWSLAHTSTTSIMLIACDRYTAVCHPTKYRKWFSMYRIKFYLIPVWGFPVIWQSYLMWVHLPAYENSSCLATWGDNNTLKLAFGVATFCWEYMVPLIVMTVTYTHTILSLRMRVLTRARNAAATQPAVNTSNKNAHKDPLQTAKVRLTITFMIVAVFFIICWSPSEITWLLFNFGVIEDGYYSSLWHLGVETPLLCLNTCVNPVIYCVTYTHFRQHLKLVFCGRCKNEVGDSTYVENTENSSEQQRSSQRARGKPLMFQVNT
ncbi:galanin receptor type 2-like [Asterias rubens]|uniref:galanin receptor type 2-like n=1 Tax=Asterias rubens TaxID=7604 RepID=UPI0014552504|nr:galanin receptor type 2-like [Asterias rubens]